MSRTVKDEEKYIARSMQGMPKNEEICIAYYCGERSFTCQGLLRMRK
ncbi:hypothetical protein PMW03_00715 [Clostridium paraputrificum]|nr:hypothetical protein [Clostridium paraputrificum]